MPVAGPYCSACASDTSPGFAGYFGTEMCSVFSVGDDVPKSFHSHENGEDEEDASEGVTANESFTSVSAWRFARGKYAGSGRPVHDASHQPLVLDNNIVLR